MEDRRTHSDSVLVKLAEWLAFRRYVGGKRDFDPAANEYGEVRKREERRDEHQED